MTPEAAKALADAGPWAVVIFLAGIVAIVAYRAFVILVKDHFRADEDDRDQRDHALSLVDRLESDLHDFATAWQDAERRRRKDD